MRLTKIILPILLMVTTVMMAQESRTYEYWIDGDYAHHKTVTGSDVNITMSTEGISSGLHFFTCRLVTGSSWNYLYRTACYIPERGIKNPETAQYEYWIDGDYANHETLTGQNASIPLAIPVSSLASGLHVLHFRVVNPNGSWDNITQALFYVPDRGIKNPETAQYEYWIDGDYANHETLTGQNASIPLAIPVSSLASGLHVLHFRVVNPNGSWDNMTQSLFYIPERTVENPEIAAYEYWIDDDWAERQTGLDVNDLSQLTMKITGLEEGEHYFVLRMKNTDGAWSGAYHLPFEIAYQQGDANGDGSVNITDAVAIVNYILGNLSSNFKIHAANVDGSVDENGDPVISITDAVGVVNIILNSGQSVVAP